MAEDPAVEMDDLAGLGRPGAQLLDHRGIVSARHEADILAVRLLRDGEPVARRERPGLGLGGKPAEREAQIGELLPRGREEEVALVPAGVGRTVQLRPPRPVQAPDIVPGRHAVGRKVTRRLKKVAELHALIASDAGNWRGAGEVGVGELVHHAGAEAVLVVEHVVREAHRLGHPPRVVDVPPGTAGALARRCRTVVVELKCDADDIVALCAQHRRDHRAVDAARHCDHDPRVLGRLA